ncbi:hypothetical protein VNO78_03268 [Psophocarpus tetragonolobus]|uniref:ATP-dependent rRNA helicase SPB4-like C-terminal extension domain-containing protein n=1 Tax=Psophocarpus tetragonolobus TaxID=3891 RepID=A0AAN9XVS9_PSOTE
MQDSMTDFAASVHTYTIFALSFSTEMDELAKKAFCCWVRAYTAYRGELKRIFMIKKLHLGHVAKSFASKQQPSLVGQSFQKQIKKRKRFEKKNGLSKKRRVASV